MPREYITSHGHAALSPLAKSLAMDPATVQRLCHLSLGLAPVIPFLPVQSRVESPESRAAIPQPFASSLPPTATVNLPTPFRPTLKQIAIEHLDEVDGGKTTVRALAARYGVQFESLMTTFCVERAKRRRAQ